MSEWEQNAVFEYSEYICLVKRINGIVAQKTLVTELVRCKECKYKDEIANYCYENDRDVNADDFCSYGKRKDEPQTIRCPKCGRTDYIRDMEKDMGIKGSRYKYKCINCNTYIKDEPQTEREGE